jgi:hypothetical protein
MDAALIRRFSAVRPGSASETTRTYSAGGRSFFLSVGDISARPVVLYVDTPAGVSPRMVDFSRITLQQ